MGHAHRWVVSRTVLPEASRAGAGAVCSFDESLGYVWVFLGVIQLGYGAHGSTNLLGGTTTSMRRLGLGRVLMEDWEAASSEGAVFRDLTEVARSLARALLVPARMVSSGAGEGEGRASGSGFLCALRCSFTLPFPFLALAALAAAAGDSSGACSSSEEMSMTPMISDGLVCAAVSCTCFHFSREVLRRLQTLERILPNWANRGSRGRGPT